MARLLLGSGGYRTDARRERLRRLMDRHFEGVGAVLFVPYALADHDGYLQAMRSAGLDAGGRLVGIHDQPDPVRAVECAEAISVGGGNSFRLLDAVQRLGLLEPIRRRVAGGMPYMGVSAGTNLACPTIMTTNDMPIVRPASFEALDLVPFQINPHYFDGQVHVRRPGGAEGDLEPHFGETRDQRIAEYHEVNDRVVVGLWEGAALVVEGDRVTLEDGAARIFRRGAGPEDRAAGADCSDLLRA